MKWWVKWTETLELVARLEVLVDHAWILAKEGLVDMQDEVSSARRVYKAVVGPSREVGFGEVLRKNDRGW